MAKQAELLDLQKTGRGFYEAKKYAEALDTFSKALELAKKWSPADVPTILDQRIAVRVKLGNIDLARKDAMSMIRTSKADGRGYMRCGQLDRLEDNLSAALRWYEHGLKHVSPTDPLHSTLDTQRDKIKVLLNQRLMASNARDPVSALPAELIQHIAMCLDYIEVVNVLRVSKTWKETFSRLKPLTDSVDFGDAKCEINYKMIAAVLKCLGNNPKRLIVKNLSGPAENLLRMNLVRWRNYTQLEELTISSKILRVDDLPFAMYNLKSLDLKNERGALNEPTIRNILNACRSLEVARFSDIRGAVGFVRRDEPTYLLHPTLRTLHFAGERSSDQNILPALSAEIHSRMFAYFPRLEELACRNLKIFFDDQTFGLSNITSLRKLLLHSCDIEQWPKLPPSIEVWDNFDTKTRIAIVVNASEEPSRIGTLAKLRSLRFNKTSPPPAMSSFMPAVATASLRSLEIRTTSVDSLMWGIYSSYDVFEHLIGLQELAWGDNQKEDGIVMKTLLSPSHLEELEILSLSTSPIHGGELIMLLKRPDSRLRKISLTDCENVSPDTIEWARSRGVTMHVKKSQAVTGSKRRMRGH